MDEMSEKAQPPKAHMYSLTEARMPILYKYTKSTQLCKGLRATMLTTLYDSPVGIFFVVNNACRFLERFTVWYVWDNQTCHGRGGHILS